MQTNKQEQPTKREYAGIMPILKASGIAAWNDGEIDITRKRYTNTD